MSEKSQPTNEASLVSGSGANVNIQNSPITIIAGGNVNNLVRQAGATTSQDSDLQTQMQIDNIEKSVNSDVKARSKVKITGSFPSLREPASQFSPQMTKIDNFFGDGIYEENMDEFKSSMQIPKGEPITREQFLQEIAQGESKRIALIGGAGFGKTTELKKLAQTLLKNKDQKKDMYNQQHFKIIHWIDLKNLHDDETTLQELLFDDLDLSKSDMEYLLDWIKHNQTKVIFLFDGLDQTRFKTGISYDKKGGLKKKRSAGCLIHNLLSGYLFPEVKIVTTSREHSVTTLPEEARPDLVIALTGFTQKDAENLFREVCGATDDEAMKNIRDIDIIKIPVYTIFAAVVHKFYKDIPKYVSCLLAKILEVFTRTTQMREINIKNIKNLHGLMAMAFEGVKSRRMTFVMEDLERHGLKEVDVSDMMSKVPKECVHLGLLLEGDILLMFCHQALQEFLAACYIFKMEFDDYKAFTYNCIKRIKERKINTDFDHWSVVVQHLAGITLNSEFKIDERIVEVSDKNRKQEILRDALRERIQSAAGRAAECLVLHESNDDSLIRQLERISIGYQTSLNSNLARVISSLMRRNESMERISLNYCGVTGGFLQIIGENMKNSHLRVKDLRLLQDEWNVSCATLNSFLFNLEVDELMMHAFPKDYHEEFPNFQEKLLKLDIKSGYLNNAVRLQNFCVADRVQVTAKEKCWADLKDLHAMLYHKWEVDGKNMDLAVNILEDSKLDALVIGCSDIREAATRWSVRSVDVTLIAKTQEFLQMFKLGNSKIHHLTLIAYDSYVFRDDDFKIISSIIAQSQVEHLTLRRVKKLKSEHLKYILQNCQLKVLQCSQNLPILEEEPYFFPFREFNEIQDAARLADTELLGIRSNPRDRVSDKDLNFEVNSDQNQVTEASSDSAKVNSERRSKCCAIL